MYSNLVANFSSNILHTYEKNINSKALCLKDCSLSCSGASKNIFNACEKKTPIENSENLSLESSKNIPVQEYFSNHNLNMKSIDYLNKIFMTCSSFKTLVRNELEGNLEKLEQNIEENKALLIEKTNYTKSWKYNYFKNVVFSPYTSNQKFYEHLIKISHGLKYAQNLIQSDKKLIQYHLVKLITTHNLKCLFVELEKTIISSSINPTKKPDFIMKLIDEKWEKMKIFINIRPYCLESLEMLSHYYNIFIFTSESKEFAQQIMQSLDPEGKIFSGCLNQSHCFKTQKGNYIKDLRIIVNKKLCEMVIIDHVSSSFPFQIENGIPILPWENDPYDNELKYLTTYLIKLSCFQDVRIGNRNYLKLNELSSKSINQI